MVEDPESRIAIRGDCVLKIGDRLELSVVAELKRSEMNRHASRRTQSEMRADRFIRIDVGIAHEPPRQIRSDRQKSQANGRESLADAREMITPARIAREVHAARRRCDHESAP